MGFLPRFELSATQLFFYITIPFVVGFVMGELNTAEYVAYHIYLFLEQYWYWVAIFFLAVALFYQVILKRLFKVERKPYIKQ